MRDFFDWLFGFFRKEPPPVPRVYSLRVMGEVMASMLKVRVKTSAPAADDVHKREVLVRTIKVDSADAPISGLDWQTRKFALDTPTTPLEILVDRDVKLEVSIRDIDDSNNASGWTPPATVIVRDTFAPPTPGVVMIEVVEQDEDGVLETPNTPPAPPVKPPANGPSEEPTEENTAPKPVLGGEG